MKSHIESAVADRRTLLRHALQDYKDRGGTVTFPVGCNGFDDWLIDALDANLVLQQMARRGNLDLILLCSSEGTLNHAILSRLPTDQDARDYYSSPTLITSSDAPSRKALPHLQIPSMAISIDERDLQVLAFQIFLSTCAGKATPSLLQAVRAHLEIGESLGRDLTSVVNLAQINGIATLTTLDSLVKLLQIIAPSAFQSFKGFISWRSAIANIVSKCFEHATAHSWSRQQQSDGNNAQARSLLASLRGSLRRLDVREPDDYEEQEYLAAARGVADAAGRLFANLNSGLALPMGLTIQLAELLLGGVFDTLDEGQFIPEAPELLTLLNENVWPAFRISSQMSTALAMWVHFRQYMASKEISLLYAGSQLAQKVEINQNNANPTAAADSAFTLKVLDAVSSEAAAALSDYHAEFQTTGEMQALLQFLGAIELTRGNDGSLELLLEQCIRASVGAAFARRAAEVHDQVSLEEDRTALLATETVALLHQERSKYVPVLRQHQPAASAIAADTLHELYGAKMLTWLIQINNLTKSVAATIHHSADLEAELLAEIEANGGGGGAVPLPQPWGALDRVIPLLHTWANTQVVNMHGWLDRMIGEQEDWTPVIQQRGASSRSAVEIMKLMEDAVDTLFTMGLKVPLTVVKILVEGIDNVLQRYCKIAMAELGSADSLVPPAPPLTRFKKELADAAEAEAMRGGPSGIKGKMGAALVTAWLPQITADQQQRILNVVYDVLVVRANSMQYLATHLIDLEALVQQRWKAAQEEDETLAAEGPLAPGFFQGAINAAAETVDQILRFITLKLICGSLRSAIFKELYAFSVEYSRITPILEEVDGALGMLCEMLAESLAPRMAGHVCKTLAAAVMHVLLDGGPHRLFTQQDIPFLMEDFDHLKAMFYAEGAGLDPEAVSKLCAPLEQALYAMTMDTQSLVAASKNTKKQPLRASASAGRPIQGGALDPDLVLRVLCHRADYNASKFLKKEHKIPKKLPNVITASVSRSFAVAFPPSASKSVKQGGIRRMEQTP